MKLSKDTLENLVVLRLTVIRILLFSLVTFIISFLLSEILFELITQPLIKTPNTVKLIASEVTASFTSIIIISFYTTLLISIPYTLFEIWRFIKPALYIKEKKLVKVIMLFVCTLFYTGIAFGYFTVLPVALNFFLSLAPNNLEVFISIVSYLDFILSICLAFGFSFLIPVFTYLLIIFKLVNIDTIKKKRPYIIISAFILGMLLTPPDVISQVLLAVPLLILFESGVFFASLNTKYTKKQVKS